MKALRRGSRVSSPRSTSCATREQSDSMDDEALEADQERLRAVEVELDRCWDLLRQRRALRDAGGDPEQAHVRDANTVERYWQ